MKKVLALVVAVMMVSTVGFAAVKKSTVSPGSNVGVDKNGFVGNPKLSEVQVSSTNNDVSILYVDDGTGKLYNFYTGIYAAQEAEAAAKSEDVTDSGSIVAFSKKYVENLVANREGLTDAQLDDAIEALEDDEAYASAYEKLVEEREGRLVRRLLAAMAPSPPTSRPSAT